MWVNRVTVRAEDFPRRDCYPFDLGWLRERLELRFRSPITFFVGENGSGKSTLLEAIVLRADIPVWTNSKRHLAHRNPYENTLYEYVDLEWASGRVSGSFFNAETFRQRAEFLDELAHTLGRARGTTPRVGPYRSARDRLRGDGALPPLPRLHGGSARGARFG